MLYYKILTGCKTDLERYFEAVYGIKGIIVLDPELCNDNVNNGDK